MLWDFASNLISGTNLALYKNQTNMCVLGSPYIYSYIYSAGVMGVVKMP